MSNNEGLLIGCIVLHFFFPMFIRGLDFISRKTFIIMLIPIVGEIYFLYMVFKQLLKEDE